MPARRSRLPRVVDLLDHEGLIEPEPAGRRRASRSATSRASRSRSRRRATCGCRSLARGDEGFLLAHGLLDTARLRPQPSVRRRDPARRGGGRAGARRSSAFRSRSARSTVTECQMVNQFVGSPTEPPQFTRGYGLVFGHAERKAMAMALVDRALRGRELGEAAERAGAGRGVRAVPRRQRRGVGLRAAPEAARTTSTSSPSCRCCARCAWTWK